MSALVPVGISLERDRGGRGGTDHGNRENPGRIVSDADKGPSPITSNGAADRPQRKVRLVRSTTDGNVSAFGATAARASSSMCNRLACLLRAVWLDALRKYCPPDQIKECGGRSTLRPPSTTAEDAGIINILVEKTGTGGLTGFRSAWQYRHPLQNNAGLGLISAVPYGRFRGECRNCRGHGLPQIAGAAQVVPPGRWPFPVLA